MNTIDIHKLNKQLDKYYISLDIDVHDDHIIKCDCIIETKKMQPVNLMKVVYKSKNMLLTLWDIKKYIEQLEKVTRLKRENYWFDEIDCHHRFFEGFTSINEIFWGS